LSYPVRQDLIAQWRGMLAAISLAEVRRLPLSVQLVDLGELRYQDPFARSLCELLPDPVNALYAIQDKNPWQDIYLFLWGSNVVGMTSPSTIVVPAEEGQWDGLPWWQDGILRDPCDFLNTSEKALLWRWLENLQNELNNHQGQPQALNLMRGVLRDFRERLGSYPDQRLKLSSNYQFFGTPLNRGILQALNRPVKAEPQKSSVKIIASPDKAVTQDLLLIDPEIAQAWGELPQNVWVYADQTLASLNPADLKEGRITWSQVRWIESKDLFLPEFTFVDLEEALPGAFPAPETQPITFKGQRITPLLPINPILLDYFTPEDLMRRLQLAPINGSEGPIVRVMLDLPLSGIKGDEAQPQNYRVFKDYLIKEENALPEVPVLEVWPHLKAKDWHEYYAFFYDGEYGEQTFQVYFPNATRPHLFQEGRGAYQITHLQDFPAYVQCQDAARNPIGLILLRTPEETKLLADWKVGVDFGTSFTNVYINQREVAQPLPLENLHLKITDVQIETRLPVLFEYFIPEDFIPPEKPLPLSSVLTTRGKSVDSLENVSIGQADPLYDGRIYVPNQAAVFNPQDHWIETDLKWQNFVHNRLFIEHLALHISALAAKKGIGQIQWSLSYPSAFSSGDKTRYNQAWREITSALESTTGITQLCPEMDTLEFFRTESLAVAQYFADEERHDLVYSTCIDMGGGTSDISVWENNNLLHQCSVQLAGRHILSQFLDMNKDFLDVIFGSSAGYQGLKEGKFNAKLDVLLRLEGENWLKGKRAFLADNPEFQGLLRLIALGTSGLYYYVGTLLGTLYQEGKYTRSEITPVYIGGNGSRLLHWLAIGGQFDRHSDVNELLSRMLSKASGFRDTGVISSLSQRPKDEVACGLVRGATKLRGMDRKAIDPLIAGENCTINGIQVGWKDRIDFEDDIREFEIPSLTQLANFLHEFNHALRDIKIEGLSPMSAFSRDDGLEPRYEEALWRSTERTLTSMLLNMKGDAKSIRPEPPFILGLKALMQVLGKEWSGK
jgi:hypothetical protein